MANEQRRVTLEEFKNAAKAGEKPTDIVPVKYGVAEIEKDAEALTERILTFVISTKDVDRDGDTIDPNGWQLENFNKGGSILWAHDSKTPVAKPVATWLEGDKLKSRAQFMPKEMNPFAFMVFEMARDLYVRGASVGFIPKKWIENAERAGWYPVDFILQELLEWSLTPVASNPNALSEARSKGIDVSPMKAWAEKFLDGETEGGLLVSKQLAEELYARTKDANTTTAIVKCASCGQAESDDPEPDPQPDPPATDDPPDESPASDGDDAPEDLGDGQATTPDVEASTIAESIKAADKHAKDAVEGVAKLADELCAAIKAFTEAFGKSGRVLSATNEDRLREARELLSQVITQVEAEPEVDDDDKIYFNLDLKADEAGDDPEPEAESISFSKDELSGIIREQVGASLRHGQGRVD